MEGSATDLLSVFNNMADYLQMDKSNLAKAPNWLVNRLKRIAPNMRDAGIEIVFIDQRPKKIIIYKLPASQSDAIDHSQ